jgi:hypothetical protein
MKMKHALIQPVIDQLESAVTRREKATA